MNPKTSFDQLRIILRLYQLLAFILAAFSVWMFFDWKRANNNLIYEINKNRILQTNTMTNENKSTNGNKSTDSN